MSRASFLLEGSHFPPTLTGLQEQGACECRVRDVNLIPATHAAVTESLSLTYHTCTRS